MEPQQIPRALIFMSSALVCISGGVCLPGSIGRKAAELATSILWLDNLKSTGYGYNRRCKTCPEFCLQVPECSLC